MNKLKKILGTGAASTALAIGFALPAAAQQAATCTGDDGIVTNICPNVSVDNSRDNSRQLGDCSAIINNDSDQDQNVDSETNQTVAGAAVADGSGGNGREGGSGNAEATNNQSATASSSATGSQSNTINFNPNCGTTNNVTHVTQQMMAAQAAAASSGASSSSSSHHGGFGSGEGHVVAQVSAPAGGVSAGAGGAVASSATSLFGLVGSLAATTAGVAFRKKLML